MHRCTHTQHIKDMCMLPQTALSVKGAFRTCTLYLPARSGDSGGLDLWFGRVSCKLQADVDEASVPGVKL